MAQLYHFVTNFAIFSGGRGLGWTFKFSFLWSPRLNSQISTTRVRSERMTWLLGTLDGAFIRMRRGAHLRTLLPFAYCDRVFDDATCRPNRFSDTLYISSTSGASCSLILSLVRFHPVQDTLFLRHHVPVSGVCSVCSVSSLFRRHHPCANFYFVLYSRLLEELITALTG